MQITCLFCLVAEKPVVFMEHSVSGGCLAEFGHSVSPCFDMLAFGFWLAKQL
jgi:hypothetical protein